MPGYGYGRRSSRSVVSGSGNAFTVIHVKRSRAPAHEGATKRAAGYPGPGTNRNIYTDTVVSE